jgi:acylpyruvate hydrolase
MKLVTFKDAGSSRLGALRVQDGMTTVVDLQRAAPGLPDTLVGLLAAGEQAWATARDALESAPASATHDLETVALQAPIPRPGKIICIGLNYRDHAEESGQPVPDYPTVFAKYANCIIGPGEPIVLPAVTEQVDYEAELAFVIGRRARHVGEDEALEYVGGYVPFNDVSARDFQMRTSQWTLGKTFDTFGPIGPALVTADEIGDPHDLAIRLMIGDEVLQESNTRHLIFPIHHLIAYLSQIMTLEPGDVIATGTPAGVGMARNPKRFLRPGDVVRVEIEGLGTLENPVIAEQRN